MPTTEDAVAVDSQNVECLIHVRFNPNGTVADIGELPQSTPAQDWFKYLSYNTSNSYQALAGGRGLFRIPRSTVDALKTAWTMEQNS
jgi:hypothetical protein